MTSQTPEIQTLVADIEGLLANKRLSRALSINKQQPRQVLEQIRDFLIRLESKEAQAREQQMSSSPLLAKFLGKEADPNSLSSLHDQEQQQSQVSDDLSQLLAPLQTELQSLLKERSTLVQEIRELEQRRQQNYSLAQQVANQELMISSFLDVLMERLAPALTPEMAQQVVSYRLNPTNSQEIATLTATEPQDNPRVQTPEQMQHLAQLTGDLDQRLLALDGTVNVVFESLTRNINTYHESLSQSLERMHNKGTQSEQLLIHLINNLTQRLQQQAIASESSQSGLGIRPSYSSPTTKIQSPLTSQLRPSQVVPPQTTATLVGDSQQVTDTDIDLDAMLRELGIEEQSSEPETTTTPQRFGTIPEEISLNQNDRVDRLYASLFGIDDVTQQTPGSLDDLSLTEEKTAEESTDTSNEQTLTTPPTNTDVTETKEPATEELTNKVVNINNTVTTPEASIELTQEVKSEIDNHTQNIETPSPEFRQEVAEYTLEDPWLDNSNLAANPPVETEAKSEEASLNQEPAVEQPDSADTITALTDLLATQPTENYIPASESENLLTPQSQDDTDPAPDISLSAEQIQQLDRDLANFDSTASDEAEETATVENSTTRTEEMFETGVLPESLVRLAQDLGIDVENEKKSEPTLETQESSGVLISSPNNNIDSAPLNPNSVWYLGIDLGTTGISAVLLNRSAHELYPIYWSGSQQAGGNELTRSFRLPTEVYLPTSSNSKAKDENKESQDEVDPTTNQNPKGPNQNLFSAQLKPYLQIALPFKSDRHPWEPILQLNEFSAVPLVWVVRSLSKLFSTLKADTNSTTQGLVASALGLSYENYRSVINQLAGIICTCPSNWSEQYRFNIREALLSSKLVQHPSQVFFVEEAIACLLSELDGAGGETVKFPSTKGARAAKTSDAPLVGGTLVINIGAQLVEMALVDLPEAALTLAHSDFMLHGFAYAGKGIEQDIICQLLIKSKWRQPRIGSAPENQTTSSNPWNWQPQIPGLDQMRWNSLGLEELELPRPGEPDPSDRIRLQQRLESSLLGQAVLDAAIALKLILQHQESYTLDLADQRWQLHRRDLESQVLIPFVRRLNRELNRLLVAKGIPTEAVNQAILTGGTGCLGVVSRWLRQKLPNAKIIQDIYLGENGSPNCSRVAYGLAMLPLHPLVLEVPRQQYTDYFLFTELLRLVPERAISFGETIQLFEGRGINTRTCQQRLLAFLEGELPPGLLPNNVDERWLTQSSKENSEYKAIASPPLFDKQGSLSYRPNVQQLANVRRYLQAISNSTQQSLSEAYTVNFAASVLP